MPSLLSIRDPLSDAKDTLSSWDKCMAKNYCKWPVIVAIVVGSLIILSVIFCIVRCACCGAEVACCCFKCCTCCCPSGRGSGHKRMKSAQPPPPPPVYSSTYQSAPSMDTRPVNQQYRSHAPLAFAPAPKPEQPQFATFETSSKPVNEDALPAMPSWSEARSTHVEEIVMPEKKDDMEMDRLDHNGSVTNSSVTGAAAIGGPGRSPGRSPVQRSHTQDTYGFPVGYQQNDSFVSSVPQRSPHSSPGPYSSKYGQQQENYRGISPAQSLSPVYGAGGYGQNQQFGRRSPNQGYNQQYGQADRGHSPVSPSANRGGYGASNTSRELLGMPSSGVYQNHNLAGAPSARSHSPGYAPSGSTRYEPPAATYPGQQTYETGDSAYPGQPTYQAYQPAQETQYENVTRKPVNGSWKDV